MRLAALAERRLDLIDERARIRCDLHDVLVLSNLRQVGRDDGEPGGKILAKLQRIREYLAAGLPVVATDLPEIRKYQDIVKIASDASAFVDEIEAALGERGEPHARRRVEAMRAESWEARVEQLSQIIESFERERTHAGR